jgi:hypothetical protein
MIFASQNLYGILCCDGSRFTDFWKLDALSNGIAFDGSGELWLGDWQDILHIDRRSGEVIEKRHVDGWDNIHTLNFFHGEPLVASTGNDSVFLGNECIFKPKDMNIRDHAYVNAAIPYKDDTIVISLRRKKLAVLFDTANRKVEKVITMPFLHNQHHPTPFMDGLFLVSDGDGIVMFNEEGKPVQKSPRMDWPRGIKVVSRTKVWAVDRHGIVQYNPVLNTFTKKIDSPLPKPIEMKQGEDNIQASALFDLVIS